MNVQSSIVTQPSLEPITLAEAKEQVRVSSTSLDAYITSLIVAARNTAEQFLGRSLVTQTRKIELSGFCESVYLPMGYVQSISSVKYLDTNGVEQTLASTEYLLVNGTEGASYMQRAYNVTWPTVRWQANAVRITYVAGYPAAGSPANLREGIPMAIKLAIRQLVQVYYDDLKAEDREAAQAASMQLLWPYRLLSF